MRSAKFKLSTDLTLNRCFRFCLAIASLILSHVTYANCPDIPVPKNIKAEFVGQKIEMNGMLLDIRRTETNLSEADIQKFYNDRWNRSKNNDYIEYAIDPWHVIALKKDNCMMTVQIKPLGIKTEVLFAVGTKASHINNVGANFPMMADSTKLSDMKSNDHGKHGRFLVFKNNYTATGNANYYNNKLHDLGWIKLFQSSPLPHDKQSIVMSFRRGGQLAEITLNYQDGQSTVVANLNE